LCESNFKLREKYGCPYLVDRKKTSEPVISVDNNNKIYRLYQCPQSVVSKQSRDFIIKYEIYNKMPNCVPPYNKISKRFIDMSFMYEKYMKEWKE
jgi:hypothetical protein